MILSTIKLVLMKQTFINFLKSLDFFGAPLFQQIDRNQSLYRSLIGGITTFLIFSASLAYSVVIIYQWQTNQFTPKIQHSTFVSDFSLLDLNYNVLLFSYWKPSVEMIDPFEANVLIPIVTYTQNYTFTTTVVLRISNETTYDGNKFIIPKMTLGYTTIGGNQLTTSEMYIQFVKCKESLLPEGEYCASAQTVEQFYSQPLNTIVMTINYKTLDSKDKMVKTSVQEFIIQLENQQCYTLNTYLQSNLFEVNDAFLFGKSKFNEYINGALISTQTNSINYCQAAFGHETYLLVYVIMSGSSTQSIYEYPHIGDILANIGSIISILFLAKYIILFLNSNYLQKSIINELIQLYYPQFANIKIQKNWRGRITKVFSGSQSYDEQEQVQFIEFFKKVTKQVKLKLSIVNMLYEISRLYFLLRSNKSQEEIRKSHLIGIRLDFLRQNMIADSEFRQCSSISDNFSRQQFLNSDDINILSLDERLDLCQREDKVPNELDSIMKDYYDLNKIV